MMTEPTLEQVLAVVREGTGWTPAELDYHMSVHGVQPRGPVYDAVWLLTPGNTQPGRTPEEKDIAAAETMRRLGPELRAYVERCRARRYAGWSRYSAGPIRYAEDPAPEVETCPHGHAVGQGTCSDCDGPALGISGYPVDVD